MFFKKAIDFLRIDTTNMELMRAQVEAFSKQIPLLYFILTVNAAALAFTHQGVAPDSLALYLPSALILICVVRLVVWCRAGRTAIDDAAVLRLLKNMTVLGCIIGILFVLWAVSLYSYGDTATQGHVTFFVALTVISCISCLMHLRLAVFMLTMTVVFPFAVYLLVTGTRVESAISVNLLLVAGTMMYIIFNSSRDFEQMIEAQVETRRLNDENSKLANIDSLTGLPNRRQFFKELHGLTDAPAATFAIGVIDLDGFKPINDLYGHAIGDRVLRETGERLSTISIGNAFLARLGGDEFGIILRDIDGRGDVLAFGEQVCETIKVPIDLPGMIANISGSIGFAIVPETGGMSDVIYEKADYALYHAKSHNRGRPVVFSATHETEIRRLGLIEQALRNADLDSEMELYFQPLFDVATNHPVGFEALARWTSAELGPVSPGDFIPVAERSDLIYKVTRTLLPKALAAARQWPDDMKVSFNLSVRDLLSEEAILNIIGIIENSGVSPRRIDLEVTETSLMSDFDRVQTSIHALKALGVNISLDDFGTGYSSLGYVHRLPLDKIKIDRSFVQDIDTRVASRSIVRTILALCSSLNIQCVVEGMETADQVQILRDLGCRTMQGYFFCKPMPESQVIAFLQNRRLASPDLPVAAA